MTDMEKAIKELENKGVEFKVEKNPYGGYYVKYPAQKVGMNGYVHTYTFCAKFSENGTPIRNQSHVTAI